MTVLIVGKPDSGKSSFAEEKAMELKSFGDGKLYYLATMQVLDEDGERRIKKHRKMREGKGFITIEEDHDILSILPKIDDPGNATVLLECISNLAGNIMHQKDDFDINEVAKKVSDDVIAFSKKVKNLIIVTNEYLLFDDTYDEETSAYVNILSLINDDLRKKSEVLYEFA